MSPAPTTGPLHVACLCAAWCRLCDSYAPVFREVTLALQAQHPALQAHWIDIEDEADLLGDLDIETFPTLVLVDEAGVRFAGPLAPQPETLQRVLTAALASPQSGAAQPREMLAFAQRLRRRPNAPAAQAAALGLAPAQAGSGAPDLNAPAPPPPACPA